VTEDRAMLLAAAVTFTAGYAITYTYQGIPRHRWPWWVAAASTGLSAAAATCLGRYADHRRLR